MINRYEQTNKAGCLGLHTKLRNAPDPEATGLLSTKPPAPADLSVDEIMKI